MDEEEDAPRPHFQRGDKRIICEDCGMTFTRVWNMKKHQERVHQNETQIICRLCRRTFEHLREWEKHMVAEHKPRSVRWQVTKSAFGGKVKELTYMYSERQLEKALGQEIERSAYRQVIWHKRISGSIKFQFHFVALMKKTGPQMEIMDSLFFPSETIRFLSGELTIKRQVAQLFKSMRDMVMEMSSSELEGSGWSFVQSEALILKITNMKNKTMGSYIPFKPRSVRGYALRSPISHTINVRNRKDDLCVLYCLILAKFRHKITGDPTNPSNLKRYLKLIDYRGVNFPVQEQDLERLEDNNRNTLNIKIFVWKYLSPKRIQPFYLSRSKKKGATECHMLLIERGGGESSESVQHLVYITDPDALFRESLGNSQQRKHLYCSSCKHFKSQSVEKMSKHFKQCTDPHYFHKRYPPKNEEYLPQGNLIPPPNSYRTEPPVLRGFADFETLHQEVEEDSCEKCLQTMKKLGCDQMVEVKCSHKGATQTKTIRCTELPAICFNLLIVDNVGEIVYSKYYRGVNAAEKFIEVILEQEDDLMQHVERYVALSMTEDDNRRFESATHCEECGDEFESPEDRCRDHNHHTGW